MSTADPARGAMSRGSTTAGVGLGDMAALGLPKPTRWGTVLGTVGALVGVLGLGGGAYYAKVKAAKPRESQMASAPPEPAPSTAPSPATAPSSEPAALSTRDDAGLGVTAAGDASAPSDGGVAQHAARRVPGATATGNAPHAAPPVAREPAASPPVVGPAPAPAAPAPKPSGKARVEPTTI